jgi:hypothetical protein
MGDSLVDLLPYTNATLHEAMRLSSVGPLSLPHVTRRAVVLGGYAIKEGGWRIRRRKKYRIVTHKILFYKFFYRLIDL